MIAEPPSTASRPRAKHCVALAAVVMVAVLASCFERGSNNNDSESKGRQNGVEDAPHGPGIVDPARPTPAARNPALRAQQPRKPAHAGATIAVRLEAEPAHLNPLLAGDAIANRLALGDVYEGLLCQPTMTARALPCLAESVEHDSAGTTWTFRLRAGVTWHDGARFGPDDVIFTYGLLAPGAVKAAAITTTPVPTWLAADFDDLRAVKKTGERTLVMTFAGHRLGRRQAFARVPILPRHVFRGASPAAFLTAPDNRRPVGTGPLRLTSWTPGESIVMERFDNYWGEPARAARIVYRLIDSRNRALRALASGSIDLAVQIPVDEAQKAAGDRPDLGVFHYDQPAYLAAVYNLRHPRLADARVRRALGMLMDRATIAQTLFSGYARAIAGPYLHDDGDRDTRIAPLPFAKAAAGALLAQANTPARGHTGASSSSAPAFAILVPAGSRTMGRIADIWAADASPHARLTVDPVPYADALARLREGRFDIALMAFTTGPDLDLFTRFHTGESENYGAVSDPALDRALEAVRAEPDPKKRRALQHQVQRRLHALQPYTFIVSDTRVGLVRAGIGGFTGAAFGSRGLWRKK